MAGPLLDFLLPTEPEALDLMELGAVYVNEERCLNPGRALAFGDRVRVHTSPRRFKIPTDLERRVLSETSDYLVIEKPFDFPTEPTVDNLKENLIEALSETRGAPFFLVHSLEIESSGLVLVAKSLSSQASLKASFTLGRIERTFAVFTETEVHSLNVARVIDCVEYAAETEVLAEGRQEWKCSQVLPRYFRTTLVSTRMRPGDIRKSLADQGSPMIGDAKNGSSIGLTELATGRSAIALVTIALSPV